MILNQKLRDLEMNSPTTQSESPVSSQTSFESHSDSQNIIDESKLLRLRFGTNRSSVPMPSPAKKFEAMLLDFSREPKIAVGSNETFDLLEYWFTRRFEYPEMYRLTQVALAAAPTEVEVERMFSALLLVLTHLRNRLSREVLDAIMLIKMNFDLIKEVKFDEF